MHYRRLFDFPEWKASKANMNQVVRLDGAKSTSLTIFVQLLNQKVSSRRTELLKVEFMGSKDSEKIILIVLLCKCLENVSFLEAFIFH